MKINVVTFGYTRVLEDDHRNMSARFDDAMGINTVWDNNPSSSAASFVEARLLLRSHEHVHWKFYYMHLFQNMSIPG